MHVGLAGLTFRPVRRLSLGFDFETASADRTYFRTSLQDYQKLRARARYQILESLSLSANFSLLNNLNPSVANRNEFRSREYSPLVYWTPGGGKWISLLGDYTYSTLRSNISYFIPQTATLTPTLYRETARIATGMFNVNLPQYKAGVPQVEFGRVAVHVPRGAAPTQYYQPIAKVSLPVTRKLHWMFEWRWYNLGETVVPVRGFPDAPLRHRPAAGALTAVVVPLRRRRVESLLDDEFQHDRRPPAHAAVCQSFAI